VLAFYLLFFFLSFTSASPVTTSLRRERTVDGCSGLPSSHSYSAKFLLSVSCPTPTAALSRSPSITIFVPCFSFPALKHGFVDAFNHQLSFPMLSADSLLSLCDELGYSCMFTTWAYPRGIFRGVNVPLVLPLHVKSIRSIYSDSAQPELVPRTASWFNLTPPLPRYGSPYYHHTH